jgi:hypothetical protein
MSSVANKNLEEPLYYHREYSNDFPCADQESSVDKDQEAPLYQRVTFAALPFIGLCKSLSMPLSLGMGSLRVISNLSTLYSLSQQGNTENLPYQLLQTAIAITALAGTILAHPIGMFITTGHDIIIEITNLAGCLQNGEYFKAAESSANILNNVLYLSMCLTGGLELSIASLAMQILIGLYHSQEEFKKGKWIEGSSHLLMAGIRSKQLHVQLQALDFQIRLKNKLRMLSIVNVGSIESNQYQIIDIGINLDYTEKKGEYCLVTSINDAGQIAGYYIKNKGKQVEYIEFIYEPGKEDVTLSKPQGYSGGVIGPGIPPYINNKGQLSENHHNDLGEQVYIDSKNQLIKRDSEKTILMDNTKKWVNQKDFTLKINNNGKIAGVIEDIDTKKHSIAIFDTVTHSLKTIPIASSAHFADINDKDQIVGTAKGGGKINGFIWHENFGFQIIPNFLPSAINNQGVVVGKTTNQTAAVYANGILRTMEDILGIKYDLNSHWGKLSELSDINNNGWIIGWGQRSNGVFQENHPFLIKPLIA